MSWLWRGAQSAVFYYLSCTPWFSYLHERKRSKERNQARAAKAGEDVEAGTYPHPLPADTNPYWQEEMVMGPSLKKGRASKEKTKTDSTKRLNTGQDSSNGEGSTLTFPSLEPPEQFSLDDETWNKKKYQRPDEHLWGTDDQSCAPYASLNSRAANKPLVSGDGAYYNARNPAVSELHPPILSNRPKHPSQALWMTQPPPPAKLMEGKERADRSRSVSNASYGSARGTGGAMAGRQASLRRLTRKLQDDIPDDMDPSPPEDDGVTVREIEPPRKRSISDPVDIDASKRKKPAPLLISSSPNQKGSRSRPGTANRPPLSTINSANGQDPSMLQVSPKDNRPVSPASSLQALQDLVPTAVAVTIRATSPSNDARDTKLPFPTELENQLLGYSLTKSKSAGDTYRPRHRWSMDV